VEHNVFRFTIWCTVLSTSPNSIYNHFVNSADKLAHKSIRVVGIIINQPKDGNYIVDLKLEVRDYGVGQVGVDIIGEYIRQIYYDQHKKEKYAINIDACKIHPCEGGKGAFIRWNRDKNEVVVDEIEPE